MIAEPVAPPIEVVTPIKPSEALRLGRLVCPTRTKGHLFEIVAGDKVIGACAVGSIALGLGLRPRTRGYPCLPGNGYGAVSLGVSDLKRLCAALGDGRAACPVERCYSGKTRTPFPFHTQALIEHLNDYHGWTDELIAVWLEAQGL